MAIDHDLLSFTDNRYETWPVILITNPKDARFSAPFHEPSLRILRSTHIRYIPSFDLEPKVDPLL